MGYARRYYAANTYVDHNYGVYTIDDESDIEFYHQVQKESVLKTCRGCGAQVRLRPDYVICNNCADKAEMGWDIV